MKFVFNLKGRTCIRKENRGRKIEGNKEKIRYNVKERKT
jgi:hypothetical protein